MHRFITHTWLAPLLFLASTAQADAAQGGPDTHGYIWADSNSGVPFEWIDISSTGHAALTGNAVNAGNVELEVPWGGIYGDPVSEIRISRNGYITNLLTANGNDETNDCPSPSVGGGGFRIYPLHDDLELSDSNGRILYQYFAQSPHSLYSCGVHVITWDQVYHEGGNPAETFSFQALLFDNLDILFQHGTGNPENGVGSTTGIQNTTASIGLSITCNAKTIEDNFAILIQPPTNVVNTVEDQFDTPTGPQVSLREAMRDTNDGGRIHFSASLRNQTIHLSASDGGQERALNLNGKSLAIDASPLRGEVHLHGGGDITHLTLNNGSWLSLANLYLEKGGDASVAVGDHSTLTACTSTWTANHKDGFGGAISAQATEAAAAFYGCEFLDNSATTLGGAIATGSGSRSLRAEQCRFWNNTTSSSGSLGGALFFRDVTSATLVECDLAMNSASNGGAIGVSHDVALRAFGCTFDDNRAGMGGAVAFRSSTAGDSSALFHYCTFFQNFARTRGGALGEDNFTSTLDLDAWHCTFFKNKAGAGGALALEDATCHVAAIIMANNGPAQLLISGTGSLDVSFGNNIETGNEGNFSLSGVSDVSDLGHYGGFVRTCLPLQHSPVIDRAIADNATSPVDARGFPTFRDGATPNPGSYASDVGAVELGPTVSFTHPFQLQSTINAAEDGGVITPTSTATIDLSAQLTIPPGKTLFIDVSSANRLQAINLRFTLENQQNVGLYGVNIATDITNTNLVVGRGSQLTMDRCRLSGFAVEDADLISNNGSLSLLRTTICNTLVENGSVLLAEEATVIARQATFSGGRQNGDAATILYATGGATVVQRCSFVENTLADHNVRPTGAVSLEASKTIPRAWGICENTTISTNTFTDRLGLEATGGLTVTTDSTGSGSNHYGVYAAARSNTIFANELLPINAAGIQTRGSIDGFIELMLTRNILAKNTLDFTNIGLGDRQIFTDGYNLSDTSPGFFSVDDVPNTPPELTALIMAKEGVLVHVPMPGSPCIDSATWPVIPPAGGWDGRGQARSINGLGTSGNEIDIGAVEAGPPLTVTTEVDEDDGSLGSGSGDSLRECLAEAHLLGGGNIGFDPSLHGMTLVGSLTVTSGITDLHGTDTGITLESPATNFECTGESQLSLIGLILDGSHNLYCRENAFGAMTQCQATGRVRVVDSASSALRNTQFYLDGSTLIFAEDSGSYVIQNCLIENAAIEALRLEDDARGFVKHTTVARNRSLIFQTSSPRTKLHLTACTFTRNYSGFNPKSDSQILLDRCILTNNREGNFQSMSPEPDHVRSLGGNLLDSTLDHLDDHPTDIGFRAAYLAPLADADGDGVAEMQPLSASPIFNTETGANSPPSEVLTVTTTDDENDSPAGAERSLREAVRDIAAGGTIIFHPSLNNATFNAGTTLELPQSMTIDATSLPLGIDLTTRLLAADGKRVALHGIHFRDFNESGTLGGAISISGNGCSLVASHCAFSHTKTAISTVAVSQGDLKLENCTFAQNTHINTSAIFLNNADASVDFCTFGEGTADAEVISGAGNLSLYASVFFGNMLADGTTAAPSIKQPQITLSSLGANVFPDTPADTHPTDVTGFSNIASVFSPFDNYAFGTAWVDSYQTLPMVGTPQDQTSSSIPPPEHDTRGVSRVFGASADAGAHENAGELTDTDGDQFPDWWESRHGLNVHIANAPFENIDGDDADLATEFQWRTDPNDPASLFSIGLDPTASGADIIISTQPGYDYLLECSTDMSDWKPADKFTGDGESMTRPQITDETRRFWQLSFSP